MNPFPALKNLSPFHFTPPPPPTPPFFSFLSYQPFTFTYPINPSLHFTLLTHFYNSLPFTFYFLLPSLPPLFYTFLTLVLKIWVLPWEVPVAPSGSLFQSVMDLFTKEYFPLSMEPNPHLKFLISNIMSTAPKLGEVQSCCQTTLPRPRCCSVSSITLLSRTSS